MLKCERIFPNLIRKKLRYIARKWGILFPNSLARIKESKPLKIEGARQLKWACFQLPSA